jgi:C-type mannose receptor
VTEEETWGGAKAFCEANNSRSDLVSIRSELENSHLTAVAMSLATEDFWIGYNDRLSQGNWEWSDGSPSHYEYWAEGKVLK